ncbi:MAG: peptide chain release factor N(5)-glutamine methyltransferase [Pseudomonadota bacterium]
MNDTESWTILTVLGWTTGYLQGKGITTARLDAEVLLAHALNMDRVGLYLNYDRPLQPPELARFRELARRRAKREPVAYIRGFKEFWSLEFEVSSPAVLIPRPETELLVEETLKAARGFSGQPLRLLEVGTGSGAVAISVAKELGRSVLASDNSAVALAVARRNAQRHEAAVKFIEADLLDESFGEAAFEVVFSNPPYVSSAGLATAPPELSFEPRSALDGGPDGLEVIRRLVQQAPRVLTPGGWLLLEVGSGQAAEVAGLLEAAGFEAVTRVPDLAGMERLVKGRQGGVATDQPPAPATHYGF